MKNETMRQRRMRRKPALPYALGGVVAALLTVFYRRSHHAHLGAVHYAVICAGLILALGLSARGLWIMWKLEPRDGA